MNRLGEVAGRVTESALLRTCLRRAGARSDTRLFRNNVGVAVYPDGSRVAYGLCPGSADLVGWRSVEITPAMVGKKVAFFVAIETKGPLGRVSADQANFLERVREAGGIAGIVRSPEQLETLLINPLHGEEPT